MMQPWLKMILAVLMLLLLLPFQVAPNAISSTGGSVNTSYLDHGFAALDSMDRFTLSSLRSLTNDNLSLSAFDSVIQTVLLPLNIREVLLDIGWHNFTAGSPTYQQWVENWLAAGDAMGIKNVFYTDQLTSGGFGSKWVNSILAADPSAATYYQNGTRAAYVSLDDSTVTGYLEKDLAMLNSFYGNHISWIGIGTGSTQNDPYYKANSTMPIVGYSNSSVSNFVRSAYFQRDVKESGLLPNNTTDPLWREYLDSPPVISMSSGLWETSSPVDIFGKGNNGNFIEMRFTIPTNTTRPNIRWYGNIVGTPAALEVAIFADRNGTIDRKANLENITIGTSSFSRSTGWQSGIGANISLSAGSYWVAFSSPLSDAKNYYVIYMKDYLTNNATAYAGGARLGPGYLQGSTIIWLKTGDGTDLAIYPYQEASVGASPQGFTSHHPFTFNTVFLLLSDRAYDIRNATITISDATNGNAIVASGVLSQSLIHGLVGWVPIRLNEVVNAVMGHEYILSVNDPSITWITVMRQVTTDPAVAGFQGQALSLLFQLGNLSWSQGVSEAMGITSNGSDAVTTGYMDAVRFSPNSNETLNLVKVLMVNNEQASGNYTVGSFNVSVWGSTPSGSAPLGPPLQIVTIGATKVPHNGYLTVTGFSQHLLSGNEYWIVFSTNSSEHFTLARSSGAHAFLVLASRDGLNWIYPGEGPTEFSFVVSLSNEKVGNFVVGDVRVNLSPSSLYAQPFVASSNSQAIGVFIGPLVPGPPLTVSINPSSANNTPSGTVIASGILDARNITYDYGSEFVQFSSVANLKQGEHYWIVIRSAGGSHAITPQVYLKGAPEVPSNASALISNNNGLGWTRVSNTTSLLNYLIASPQAALPQLSTREVFNDLSAYHSFPVLSGVLRGWNAYVSASELLMANKAVEWLDNSTGSELKFYTNPQPNVLTQLSLNHVEPVDGVAETNSCTNFLTGLESTILEQTYQHATITVDQVNRCATNGVSELANNLNFVPYFGKQFGFGTTDRILVVGDMQTSNITRYLSNSFDAVYVDLSSNPNLEVQGGLSSYKLLLWLAGGNDSISPSTASLLSGYLKNGGRLLTTNLQLQNGVLSASQIQPNFRLSTSFNTTSFLSALLVHTDYAREVFKVTSTNYTYSASASDLVVNVMTISAGMIVTLTVENRVILQLDAEYQLISNGATIMLGVSPPILFATVSPTVPQGLEYSVRGTHGGPLLIWIHNPSDLSADFSVRLDGNFYGISGLWKAVDPVTLAAFVGSGPSVQIQIRLQPRSLTPVLILPTKNFRIDYSSALVLGEQTYPNQALYSLQGSMNQAVQLIVSSNISASQVILDGQTVLPQVASPGQLDNKSNGWYFDSRTVSLVIRYQAHGVDSIRFLYNSPPQPPVPHYSIQSIAIVLSILIGVELTVLAYFRSTHRGKKSTSGSTKV